MSSTLITSHCYICKTPVSFTDGSYTCFYGTRWCQTCFENSNNFVTKLKLVKQNEYRKRKVEQVYTEEPMSDKPRKIWMVFRENGNVPTRIHKTQEEANEEARRLARNYPNSRFYVLMSVGAFIAIPPEPPQPLLKYELT